MRNPGSPLRTIVQLRTAGRAACTAICLAFAASPAAAQGLLDSSTLAKYVDALPNPLANPIAPVGVLDGAPYYEVSIGQFTQKLHRDLAPTTLWGYNNSYPGPLFNVQAGQTIKVKWTNNLVDGLGQPLRPLAAVRHDAARRRRRHARHGRQRA